MKKALAALAFAVLMLAGLFTIRHMMATRAAAPRFAYADMTAEAVVRLHVSYWGDSVTLVKEAGQWVTSRDRFPADTARLRRVLGHLLGLQTREQVSRRDSDRIDAAELAAYDLDATRARHVTWTLADGRSAQVSLGKVSGIDYGSSFWKPSGEAVIYRTPGTFVFDVSSRSQDWKDTALFPPFVPSDIQTVSVAWRGDAGRTEYILQREGEDADTGIGAGTGYVLHADDGTRIPARREDAARLFMHAAQFRIDEFVGGEDTAATPARRASLEDPYLRIRITLRDGTTHDVLAGDVVHDLYRYVKHPRHPDPVRVFVWRFDYFEKTHADFVGEEGESNHSITTSQQ